jgi:hypothetical protein
MTLFTRLIEYANSKEHSIQSITDKNLVADLTKEFPSDFFFVSKQLTIKKMAALVCLKERGESEPSCLTCGNSVSDKFPWRNNKTTEDRITPYGSWAMTCSPSCAQLLIEENGTRKQTFMDRLGVDNPMKDREFAKNAVKNRVTDWDAAGIRQTIETLGIRGVDPAIINSIDFHDPVSKAEAIIKIATRLEADIGREPTRAEISEFSKIQYSMINRWLRGSDEHAMLYIASRSISAQQAQVKEFVESLGFSAIMSDRTMIAPYEIDILIPSANLGIEFHGIWNHSFGMGKDKNYHLNKTEMAENKGINLLQIYDVEWNDPIKQEIWKSMIRVRLGVIINKIPARKTLMKSLTSKQATEFFENSHLAGHTKATTYMGLFSGDELVQAVSYGKTRFGSGNETEIIRMATKKTLIVVGGMNRLLNHVKNNADSIVCFADRRFASHDGCAYANGLTLIGTTDPNWYAFSKKEYYLHSRHEFMKHRLKAKFGDKFDSGNLKFVWERE